MPNFENHSDTIQALEDSQGVDMDMREHAREARLFLDKRDGQWEPEVWNQWGQAQRPRYTLDKCNPIVNQIAGEIKKADFGIRIRPNGGEASEENAELLQGMIRNIQNISGAQHIFNHAAKNMTGTGISGWMVTQDWADTDSFDQDLFIKRVPNFVDSVWFDPNSQEPDRSDAKWGVKLTALSRTDYFDRYPEGSGASVGQGKYFNAYWHKADQVIVGEMFAVNTRDIELVRMTNGAVYRLDDVAPVLDELAQRGITIHDSRKRPEPYVTVQTFDANDWLTDRKDTVFRWVPLIPCYGNFNIVEDKIIYHGAIEKLLDAQRIYNYARSRQIEEGALSPKEKIMMTKKQAEGHQATLRTMNTNTDPVQFYNPDPQAPQPYKLGGAQVNPSLAETAGAMTNDIVQASGLFSASMGDNPGLQSGIAIEQLQERGDTGTLDYFEAVEIAISHTAKILVDAIPKVYDTQRQIRILGEDGEPDVQIINQVVMDEQTGQPVVLNDLSKGRYDVTCSAGKSFKSRQQESVGAIVEVAQIDPSVIELGGDILLKNTNAPGLGDIAERKREQLFKAGLIPIDQMTDEEKQKAVEKAQQEQTNQQPDAATILAQAEQTKAQADVLTAQTKQQQAQIDLQEAGIKVQQDQQSLDLQAQQQQFDQMLAMQQQQLEEAKATREALIQSQEVIKLQAETLKTIKEAIGADAIMDDSAINAYSNQAGDLEQNT